jgi:uncharacterized protein (TIGR02646 family)
MTPPFTKRHAPPLFQAWIRENKPTANRSWEDLRTEVKAAVRKRLHKDQYGLCCYCYVQVACNEDSHIEHVEPQSPENRFEWQNLALACEGGNKGGDEHCDHAKGQQRLDAVHPYKAPVIRFVSLRSSGELKLQDETARRDINEVLELNANRLRSLRRSALQSALADLQQPRRRQGDWTAQHLAQTMAELQRRTTPLSYQPLLEDWLQRRLTSRSERPRRR